MAVPSIAIVGRPNVGKSTLFNRLVGRRQAVVWKERGTTRDRLYAPVTWNQTTFALVDTGGYDEDAPGALPAQVHRQIARAIAEAAVVVFVCDAQTGLTPGDETLAARLRRSGKRILLAVNKADEARDAAGAAEFFRLGFGPPLAVSAMHGRGVSDLLDGLAQAAGGRPAADTLIEPPAVRLAIVGRPNVGKSTLFNHLLQDERAIVSRQPGTTRDALDTQLLWRETPVVLVDTAGLRHRSKLAHPVDLFSRARATEAILQCDAALVLLDASAEATNDDQRIVHTVLETGKGCVLLANKWDLVHGLTPSAYAARLQRAFGFAAFVPLVCISAATGRFVANAMQLALRVARRRTMRLRSVALNACLHGAFRKHLPGVEGRTPVKLLSATQLDSVPPTIALCVNRPERLTRNYLQYLEGALRRDFELEGVPVRLQVRGREAS